MITKGICTKKLTVNYFLGTRISAFSQPKLGVLGNISMNRISLKISELLKSLDELIKLLGEPLKFFILLLLQGFSLVTTVEGAKIIAEDLPVIPFPIVNIPTYSLLGMGIQLMIFWLLIFGKRGGIKSPLILWLLIITLTLCSIYTSFFSLYKGLSNKDLDKTTIALEQSTRITTEIFNSPKYIKESEEYPPKKDEFDKSNVTWNKTCTQAVKSVECQNIREKLSKANGNLNPLLRVKSFEEYGKKIIDYRKKIKTNDESKNYSEKNKRNFKSLQASAIHEENKSIISKFGDVISESVKRQQQSSEGYLLFPIEKLLSGDQYAIIALLIAFLVDSIAILLGMDSDKNNGNKFRDIFVMFSRNFRNEAHDFLPGQISFFSHIITNTISSLSGAIQKLISVIFSGIRKILHPFSLTKNMNILQIEGTRQDFINILLDSLDETEEGHVRINKKQLALYSSENDSFKRGYQTLIERMLILKWIVRIDENYYKITEDVKFHNWYIKERNKLTSHDDIHSVSHSDKLYTIVSIPKKSLFDKKKKD